jgi:uncharacterized lipoprotein YajG
MACQVGKVDKMDVDSKGFAIGGALRVRVWVEVNQSLNRWVQVESGRTKDTVWYDMRNYLIFAFLVGCWVMRQ